MENIPEILYAKNPEKIANSAELWQNSGNLEISTEFLYAFETLQNPETPTKP
jgi:hypothetical protein